MNQRIYGGTQKETGIATIALRQLTLYIATPKKLLGWTYDKKQKQGNQPTVCAILHAINHIYLGTGEVKQPTRHLVPHPEKPPKQECNDKAKHSIDGNAAKTLLNLWNMLDA